MIAVSVDDPARRGRGAGVDAVDRLAGDPALERAGELSLAVRPVRPAAVAAPTRSIAGDQGEKLAHVPASFSGIGSLAPVIGRLVLNGG